MCLSHILLSCLPVDTHLGCLHTLAIVNNAAMNLGAQVSFQDHVFSALGLCPGMEDVDHMVARTVDNVVAMGEGSTERGSYKVPQNGAIAWKRGERGAIPCPLFYPRLASRTGETLRIKGGRGKGF